jgi:RNA-binding protein YhbY
LFDASDAKENGTEDIDVLGVEIVPHLTVTIEHATPIHIDIFTTKLEKGGRILESLVEGVGLPIVRVIGKLDVALDVWK